MSVTVTITINNSGISCDNHGGSFHIERKDKMTWQSSSKFYLDFETFRDNGTGDKGWPFDPPVPTFPVNKCTATLTKGSGIAYYKYTIIDETKTKKLDPIIIVDR